VAEWVRRATGLSRAQTWRSGYRSDVIGDGQGSDGYGYDFEVPLDNGRVLLLEVKSSHVLEPSRCEITPLPNPCTPEGFSHYNLVGRAFGCAGPPPRPLGSGRYPYTSKDDWALRPASPFGLSSLSEASTTSEASRASKSARSSSHAPSSSGGSGVPAS